MFKALREPRAQTERYTEASKFDLLLCQLRMLRLREGGTTVTCGGENTKTHICDFYSSGLPSSKSHCPWCLYFGLNIIWGLDPNREKYFNICGSVLSFVQVLTLLAGPYISILFTLLLPVGRGDLHIEVSAHYMPDTFAVYTMQSSQQCLMYLL